MEEEQASTKGRLSSQNGTACRLRTQAHALELQEELRCLCEREVLGRLCSETLQEKEGRVEDAVEEAGVSVVKASGEECAGAV